MKEPLESRSPIPGAEGGLESQSDSAPIADPRRAKKKLRRRLKSSLFLLPAWFAPSSNLRVAFHRARGVKVESGVEIGYMVIIDNLYPELVTVRSGATVSARATILAHDEAYFYVGRGAEIVAPTSIGRGSFIGVNAVILAGVEIGEGAIVGAGAVVTGDVAGRTVVVGVPAHQVFREVEK
jgi:acetyltransferase-like isoleucine patch superfamily enzyme